MTFSYQFNKKSDCKIDIAGRAYIRGEWYWSPQGSEGRLRGREKIKPNYTKDTQVQQST